MGNKLVKISGAVVVASVVAVWQWSWIDSSLAPFIYGYSSDATHYDILQVPMTASTGEIARAYRSLSKQYHPDKTKTSSQATSDIYKQNFYKVSAAYDTLSNPQRRQEYNHHLLWKKPPSSWSSKWQVFKSYFTATTCSYVFGFLGLMAIVTECVVFPVRRLVSSWWQHPRQTMHERHYKLQQAREKLQERYNLQAKACRKAK